MSAEKDGSGDVGRGGNPRGRSARALREETCDHRELEATADARRAAVDETAGTLTGVYGRNELEALRRDWPA